MIDESQESASVPNSTIAPNSIAGPSSTTGLYTAGTPNSTIALNSTAGPSSTTGLYTAGAPNSELSRSYSVSGPLQALLDDESIEEIWINSPTRVFAARNGKTELVPLIMSAQEIRDSIERMLAWSGRRVDLSQPFVDAQLPNGARLHVVIPNITSEYWTVNIRKRAIRAFSLSDLIKVGTVDENLAQLLQDLLRANVNILVSGATQAGKTTVLNCLLGELQKSSRLITIEEVFELTPKVADHVAMQTRQASLDGAGEVTLRMLIRESLRMRPTHVVIGEVRGAEALDLLLAFNSGIPGAASIHANSSVDALRKMSALTLLAGSNIVREFSIEAVRTNIDLVIHCEKSSDGTRRISEIALTDKNNFDSTLRIDSLMKWNHDQFHLSKIDFDNYPKLKFLQKTPLLKCLTSNSKAMSNS